MTENRTPIDAPLEHGTRHAPINVPEPGTARQIQVEFDKLAWFANRQAVGQVWLDRMASLATRVRDQITRLQRIDALHVSDGAESPICSECGHAWPCATARTKGV